MCASGCHVLDKCCHIRTSSKSSRRPNETHLFPWLPHHFKDSFLKTLAGGWRLEGKQGVAQPFSVCHKNTYPTPQPSNKKERTKNEHEDLERSKNHGKKRECFSLHFLKWLFMLNKYTNNIAKLAKDEQGYFYCLFCSHVSLGLWCLYINLLSLSVI